MEFVINGQHRLLQDHAVVYNDEDARQRDDDQLSWNNKGNVTVGNELLKIVFIVE